MKISPHVLSAALRNGTKRIPECAERFHEPFAQVEAVVRLLAEATSPAAQRGARSLLHEMKDVREWAVIRGAHRSQADPTLHVLIEVAGTRYHLRLDAGHCVFDITYVDGEGHTMRLSGCLPHVAPGT